MKITYEKLTGNKYQGEFRDFDIDNLENGDFATNEIINIYDYIGKYTIYIKAEVQSKYLSQEEIKNAPKLILIKK